MSDALCGPSNALQNFQKHASVDRTLQQDRIISRQSPSQGFRSQNPSHGVLDPEFAAFESGLAGAPLPDVQHAGPFVPPSHQFPVSGPAESSNWAADFQNMHISGPSHSLHQTSGPSVAPMAAMSQQGWQNEFAQQQRPSFQQHQPHVQGLQPTFAPRFPMTGAAFPPAQATAANQQPMADTFDESAFEAAFEQARADMMSQETETTPVHAEEVVEETNHVTAESTEEKIKIGSDTIPQTEKNDQQARVNDADELARTAGQLLDSVKHDQSQKFRESNFLALMRRIRDREVQIEGDEFREIPHPLHPGGKYYPERRKERQGQTIGDTDHHARGDATPNTTSAMHGISSKGNSASITRVNNPESSPGGFGPSGDYSAYGDWRHGDRWA
ncbi:peroxin-20 [Aspergillus costaricaensis CBS 115574]|uniref:Peroxin-20 n=1 Tax=Aspergillus costaricaensis CBS 115574 TaxID=1448317 RepID=A0ACD1I0A2_9EURO|nr:peroxin-20 [Aspergillus costaricaensis CBS 115574]RAK83424.1 peroxin-20 [Aspergillus costaricaensis CBS 115574]